LTGKIFVVALLILAVHARAEKRITVKIKHSPTLAVALGKRISLGRVSGDCGKEFGDLLLADMRARGVTIETSNPDASLVPAAVLSVKCHPLRSAYTATDPRRRVARHTHLSN
jgi:hypothetical protein